MCAKGTDALHQAAARLGAAFLELPSPPRPCADPPADPPGAAPLGGGRLTLAVVGACFLRTCRPSGTLGVGVARGAGSAGRPGKQWHLSSSGCHSLVRPSQRRAGAVLCQPSLVPPTGLCVHGPHSQGAGMGEET